MCVDVCVSVFVCLCVHLYVFVCDYVCVDKNTKYVIYTRNIHHWRVQSYQCFWNICQFILHTSSGEQSVMFSVAGKTSDICPQWRRLSVGNCSTREWLRDNIQMYDCRITVVILHPNIWLLGCPVFWWEIEEGLLHWRRDTQNLFLLDSVALISGLTSVSLHHLDSEQSIWDLSQLSWEVN